MNQAWNQSEPLPLSQTGIFLVTVQTAIFPLFKYSLFPQICKTYICKFTLLSLVAISKNCQTRKFTVTFVSENEEWTKKYWEGSTLEPPISGQVLLLCYLSPVSSVLSWYSHNYSIIKLWCTFSFWLFMTWVIPPIDCWREEVAICNFSLTLANFSTVLASCIFLQW